jgi:hypothetical protein
VIFTVYVTMPPIPGPYTKEQLAAMQEVTDPIPGRTYLLVQGDGSKKSDFYIGKYQGIDPLINSIVLTNVKSAINVKGPPIKKYNTGTSAKLYEPGSSIAVEKATYIETPSGEIELPDDVKGLIKGYIGRGRKNTRKAKKRSKKTRGRKH